MRKWLFLLLLQPVWGFAQVYVPLVRLDKALDPDRAEAYSHADAQGSVLLIRDGGEARLYLFDANFQLQREVGAEGFPAQEEADILGVTLDESHIRIYVQDRSDLIQVIEMGRNGAPGNSYRLDVAALKGTGSHWEAFTFRGEMHVLRIPASGGSIRLCRFSPDGSFYAQEFPVKASELLRLHRSNIRQMDSLSNPGLDMTWNPAKVYFSGDYIYLTLDERERTHILKVYLAEGYMDEWSVSAPQVAGPSLFTHSNSYLCQDNLYQVAAGADSLRLRISSLGDSTRRQEFVSGLGQWPFPEISGPVFRDEVGVESALPDAAAWYDAAKSSPHIAVSVQPDGPESLRIEIGAVTPSVVRGVSGMVIEEKVQVALFSARLRREDFAPLAPMQPLALRRLPPNYRSQALPTAFRIAGRQVLGYYDPDRQQYVMLGQR